MGYTPVVGLGCPGSRHCDPKILVGQPTKKYFSRKEKTVKIGRVIINQELINSFLKVSPCIHKVRPYKEENYLYRFCVKQGMTRKVDY